MFLAALGKPGNNSNNSNGASKDGYKINQGLYSGNRGSSSNLMAASSMTEAQLPFDHRKETESVHSQSMAPQ